MPFSAPDIDTGLPTAGDSLVASNLTMEVQALAAALEREKELRLQAEAHAVAAHTEAKFQAEMAEKDSDESAKQIAELARRVIELSAGHESAQRQLHSAMDKAVEFARRAAAAEEELDRMRRAAAENEVTQMAANIERLKRVANQKKQRAAELRAGQSQPQPEPEPEPELEQEPEPVLVLNSTEASAEFSAQLFAWLREELTAPKLELIYRASRDGWKRSDFRKLCDIEAYTPVDNVSELTARTNDEGWDTVFAAWLRTSKANANDVVFVFSVGGGNEEKNVSANIIHGLIEAKSRGLKILGVVGRDGGYTKQVGDVVVVIPTVDPLRITPHTEAFQAVVWHCLVSDPALQQIATKW